MTAPAFFMTFSDCNMPIEFIRIDGGGRTILGRCKGSERGRMAGPDNNDFDSAALILELFRKARG
jgi:hypothetical protein